MMTPCGTIIQAQSVYGKTLRGTPIYLVSRVQHGSGTTLVQDYVAQKRNEITAVPTLIARRDLTDTVINMDALLTQHPFAQQSMEQCGHYLLMVKRNQPQ